MADKTRKYSTDYVGKGRPTSASQQIRNAFWRGFEGEKDSISVTERGKRSSRDASFKVSMEQDLRKLWNNFVNILVVRTGARSIRLHNQNLNDKVHVVQSRSEAGTSLQVRQRQRRLRVCAGVKKA